MSESIVITIILFGALLLALIVGFFLMFGNIMPGIIALLMSYFRDSEDLVNADAPILPNQERKSSEVLKDLATQVKAQVPVIPQQAAPTEVLYDEYGNPVQIVTYVVPAPQAPVEQAPPQT